MFRFDTFGDETKWTDTLRMNEVVATVDPTTALSVGLKVDSEALPAAVVTGIQDGSHQSHDPATTVALLKLDAVVGVKGTVETIGGNGHADAGRHHLRAVPFDRRQLVCARHRQAPGRLAQPRSQRRGHRRAVACARRADQGGLQLLGPGEVRSSLQPGRPERPAGHPARLRPGRHPQHHVHGGWPGHRLLESLRRRHADGRTRDVLGAAHGRERHQRDRRSDQRQAASVAGLSAHARGTGAAGGQLRPSGRRAGQALFAGKASCSTCHSGPEFTDANTRLHPAS